MPCRDGRGPANGGNNRAGNRNGGCCGGRGRNAGGRGQQVNNAENSVLETVQRPGFGNNAGRGQGFGRGICRQGFGANLQNGDAAGQGIAGRKRLRDQSCINK